MKTEILAAIAALSVLIIALGIAVGLITAKLPTNYIMGSSNQTDKDDEIDAILIDTSAYDTDAEHAAAIWNAAIASYGTAGTYGEELEDLDPNIIAIKAITDVLPALMTTVASATDPNTFVLTSGLDVNDVYCGMTIYVQDATDSHWESRLVIDWEVGRTVTVDLDFGFTPAAADLAYIWGQAYFPLDVYNGLPLPPEGETLIIDRRVVPAGGSSGGTRTLDAKGDDPP